MGAPTIVLFARRRRRRRRRRQTLGLSLAALLLTILTAGTLAPAGPATMPVPAEVDVQLGGAPLQVIGVLGSVWVLTCDRGCSGHHSSGQLVRVRATDGHVVQRIAVADPQSFSVGEGAIWIAHSHTGTVTRVGPDTGRISRTISLVLPRPVTPGDRAFVPFSISAGAGAVWVSTARGWIARLDPDSGRVVSMVKAPFDVTGEIVAGSRVAWVAESSLGLGIARVNRRRLKLLPLRTGSTGVIAVEQLTVGGGRVWAYGEIAAGASVNGGGVLTDSARITIIDEASGRTIHQLRFPAGPFSIAFSRDSLFAANFRTGRLYRIDANSEIHTLGPVRGPGTLVAVTPGAVWATAAGQLRRVAVLGT